MGAHEKPKGQGGKHEKHKHQYITIRVQARVVDGKTVTYIFKECISTKGKCPEPNKMEIDR